MTDDPEPVEFHHWEINAAVTGSWHGDLASLGVPSVDINYGVAPNVQLHAQPRYSIERDGGTEKGLDDTEIGVKYRFYEHKAADESAFSLAIYPMYLVATGDKKLGEDRGTRGIFLPLWAQYDHGPWTIYGGGGYRLNRGPDGRNSTFTGVTVLRQLSETLQLGVEAFHETPAALGAESSSGFNIGGARQLAPSMSLLFSAGKSFGEGAANLFYLGLQTRF